jgi:hypothetical protein
VGGAAAARRGARARAAAAAAAICIVSRPRADHQKKLSVVSAWAARPPAGPLSR